MPFTSDTWTADEMQTLANMLHTYLLDHEDDLPKDEADRRWEIHNKLHGELGKLLKLQPEPSGIPDIYWIGDRPAL